MSFIFWSEPPVLPGTAGLLPVERFHHAGLAGLAAISRLKSEGKLLIQTILVGIISLIGL